MCAVCSECSLNLVAGQVFVYVGACPVGFFSDLYNQGTNVAGYIVFALVVIVFMVFCFLNFFYSLTYLCFVYFFFSYLLCSSCTVCMLFCVWGARFTGSKPFVFDNCITRNISLHWMNALLEGNDCYSRKPVITLKSTVEMPMQNASYVLMNSLIQWILLW